MDARMWHHQAMAPAAVLPEPLPVAAYRALPAAQQAAYRRRLTALQGLVLDSPAAGRAGTRMSDVIARNGRRPKGAKDVVTVSAPFAAGKSTFVKAWAQAAYRQQMTTHAPHTDRPTWQPEPGMTADWVPQLYITLRAASKIMDLNAALLAFLGYPSEGAVRVATTRVLHVLKVHRVELLIIDDAHMVRQTGVLRDTLDYLKMLITELGELGGTMMLVGAKLDPIHEDPQIKARLTKIFLQPYAADTDDDRRSWQQLLRRAETVLLPYLDTAPPGVFARQHAGHIWRRTQGYVGDTTQLLVEALLAAQADGAPTITREHLDAVPLPARAAAAEADLVTARTVAARRGRKPARVA